MASRLFNHPAAHRLAALLVVLPGGGGAFSQNLEIGWFSIDCGGGYSQGGPFRVLAVSGQSDAGVMTGGRFSLHGGFLAGVHVLQTPGAPQLWAWREPASGIIHISWTLPDEGWVLEESPTLGRDPKPWSEVDPGTYQSDTQTRFITVPDPDERNFFRLRKVASP